MGILAVGVTELLHRNHGRTIFFLVRWVYRATGERVCCENAGPGRVVHCCNLFCAMAAAADSFSCTGTTAAKQPNQNKHNKRRGALRAGMPWPSLPTPTPRQDLAAVVDHLLLTKTVSRIGFWGRSMGAVTAIMYGSRDPSVCAGPRPPICISRIDS